MLELIYIIFALPVVCAALAISGVLGSGSLLHWLNRLTAAAVGVAVILLAQSFTPTQPFNSEYVYLDALNVWVILIITALYVVAAWVSKSYLLREHSRGYLSRTNHRQSKNYINQLQHPVTPSAFSTHWYLSS